MGLALFFVLRAPDPENAPDVEEGSERVEARTERPGTALQPEAPEDLGARGSADPGSTPGLSQPPSEADGVLEVEVVAGERPVPGATVRLYWRGPRDPNLNEVSWRLASTGVTDAQGRARLASRPGGYQVAVRAQGYGPVLRDVVRPYGEARTLMRLSLEPGQTLTGHTVEADTPDPLPLVELVLTAHGRKLERWQDAAAPAEERAYASSNARGDFRVEGLAPGNYTLEARAVGYARTELRPVKVPSVGPLTVELRKAGVIEGFVVDAQGHPAAGAEVQVGGRVPEVATTGEGGGFSVEVEPGDHTVSARRGSEAGSLPNSIIIGAGKTVRDLRIQLGQSAVLEGRVVANTAGTPIEGARVDVSPYRKSGDSGRAVTDGSGRFSVGGLAPGSYDVVASAPGFSTVSRSGLTVASGERFSLELKLTGTGAVEGSVRDRAGQPVPGARVLGGSRWGGLLGEAPAESRTDAEGHYRLEGVAAGELFLSARWEGAPMGSVQQAEVKEGSTTKVDLTLDATGTVEGVVRAAQGALPPEPLSVNAVKATLSRSEMDVTQAETDATGHFRLVLPPGPYEVWLVSGKRLPHLLPKRVQVEAGKTVQTELTWTPPEEKPTEGGIRGIVLEPDGTPSVSAFVTLSVEGPRSRYRMESTDAAGRFSFSFDSGDPVTSSARVRLKARNGGRTGEVPGVKPGEQSVVVRLQPPGALRGQVVRASGGAPVQGFTLTLEKDGPGSFLGNRGPWEFPGNRFELGDVPAEEVKVRVRTEDGATGEALTSTRPGAVSEVEVALKSAAGVRGRVMDGNTKEPLADAWIFVEGSGAGSSDSRTGADGRFSLERLMPGAYTLMVMAGQGRTPARQPVKLEEGQVLDVGDISITRSP
ncbi:hypothetical protein DB31_6452 [Hyalangium minutum]|uniref:Carboxypeptidase regulatory-like domain-containing protein n=1 Tax=Hyalangium minutum TaxID=394096 RepID=A0A085WP64_9BACT|nr:hypothetical protein DB31_6452 [Hyalangium minutum]